MRTVIGISQHVQEARRGIFRDPPGMRIDDGGEKRRVGMRRLECIGIERWGKIIGKDAIGNSDSPIERIIVEEAAAAARRQRRLVAGLREPIRQAVMKPADAALEQIVRI